MSIEMKIPENLEVIDSNNLSELIWWSAHLGIGPEKLLKIISKVGNSVNKICRYISEEKEFDK